MTSLRELLRELPYALLIPSVAACAAVCALLARYVAATMAGWLDDRWRAHRLAARRDVGDGLADGAVVTLRGTLATDGEGATLRTRDATVALGGPFDLRAHGRAVSVEALKGRASDVIVRGVYRRKVEAAGAEAYRGASTQHTIAAEGGRIEVTSELGTGTSFLVILPAGPNPTDENDANDRNDTNRASPDGEAN